MRYHRLKKYVIHVLSVAAIREDTFDLPQQQNAIVVCTHLNQNSRVKSILPQNKLILDFPDVEDPHYPGSFNQAHARRIIRFVQDLPDDVTDLYVSCSKGSSRSPAVAAALLRMSGRSDKAVWLNPYYVPNLLVYYRLCRAWGFHTPLVTVWFKHLANRRAFRVAKKRQSSKYERWQILF